MSATLEAPPFASMKEAVARIVEEAIGERVGAAADLLAEWESACAEAVRRDWQVMPPSRERLLKQAEKGLVAMRAVPELARGLVPALGRPLAGTDQAEALRPLLERLVEGLSGWKTDEDFRRLSLGWYPLDEEALRRRAAKAPSQAAYDEDWSDLMPSAPQG